MPIYFACEFLKYLFRYIPGFLFFFYSISFAQQSTTAEQLLKDLACGSCHSGIKVESDIREKAPDLSQVGLRLGPDYIFNYLQFPTKLRQNIGYSRMPNFHFDEKELLALTLFLQKQVPKGDEQPIFPDQKIFEKAKADYPDVTAEMGEKIVYSQNCVACHKLASIAPEKKKYAPDLSIQGLRVNRTWLAEYLKDQEPIRPFGFYPGTGSRHPNFMLSEIEADILTKYLFKQKGNFEIDTQSFFPEKLSPFSMAKAKKLISDKFSCLGCHQLGREGGKIGPDLSSLKNRLQADFVYQVVRDPISIIPETIMPKIEMPEKTLHLIVNFLIQQEIPSSNSPYLSLIENELVFNELLYEENQYAKYCGICHGNQGDGNGYNAKYLPTTPTKHSDSVYMATRPDDTIFDGIFAGAYILNKNHRMPPWGYTLKHEDIRGLVTYIRELCQCRGPSWSRDNKPYKRK